MLTLNPDIEISPEQKSYDSGGFREGSGVRPGSNWCFSFAPELVGYSAPRDLHRRAAYSICESWFLVHQRMFIVIYLFVLDDSLTS